MFCVEEHKWGYFTRIYIGALIPRVYIGTLATHPHLGATRPQRTYIYTYIYAWNNPIYVLQHKTQNFRPNYLFLQSRERTFALLLVPREKKFEKSFIL